MAAHISLFTLDHAVYRISAAPVGQIFSLPRNDVGMHMRDALASVYAVLDGDVERRSTEDAFHHARDTLHRQEEVLDLCRGEVVEAGDDAAWRDQNMAGEEGLEVDQGVREGRRVEDLQPLLHSTTRRHGRQVPKMQR